jgi:hypothetical protein
VRGHPSRRAQERAPQDEVIIQTKTRPAKPGALLF